MVDAAVISISIVSHGQASLVKAVMDDLARLTKASEVEVLLTINVPEELPFSACDFPYPVKVIENAIPRGFGSNHNAASQRAVGEWFCVMNPDIRLGLNPFPILLEIMMRYQAAAIAPVVLTPAGKVEDSARHFPTPLSLFLKLFGQQRGYGYSVADEPFPVDWVGGMFMLFRIDDFKSVGGFDEKYFLYYEDVDLCVRLWRSGRQIVLCPKAQVVHAARRDSRRKLRYMFWHISSLLRYLIKHWLRFPDSRSRQAI